MPVPGWRLRISLAGVDALALEVRRHADVADDHVGARRSAPATRLVVVVGDADDLEVALACQHRRHALADDDAVVGEEHGDRLPRASVNTIGRTAAQRGGTTMRAGGASHTSGRRSVPLDRDGRRWRTMQA